MSKDFFDKPFDEETKAKLELYENYVKEWLPVFLARNTPLTRTINIFDFFSGPGKDSIGISGSPLIVVKALMTDRFRSEIRQKNLKVNLYFNDKEPKYIERLKENIKELDVEAEPFNINFEVLVFEDVFEKWIKEMNDSANLVFLDQFGIECVKKDKFQLLTKKSMTDIIFFISSSFFNRFHWHDTFKGVLDISKEEIEEMSFYNIHKLVLKKYEEFIPKDLTYYLAPYSIKRGSNINGLIFGSRHILGVEKFLKVCWDKDKLRGEANFDIDKEKIDLKTPGLFPEYNIPSKIDLFEKDLKNKILEGKINNDKDFMIFSIRNGFIGKHAKKVIGELIDQKKINKDSFTYNSRVVYKKEVLPKKIELK
jgi:three-Cys-motif partner protein